MVKSHALLGTFVGKLGLVWLAIGLIAGMMLAFSLVGPGNNAKADNHIGPTVVVSPTEANFQPDTDIWLYGSNLTPGIEINIIVVDSNGVWSDITTMSAVHPLIVNEDGAFATHWTLDRWTQAGVGGEEVVTVRIMDEQFNTLGTAPLALCDHNRDEGDEVPGHCSQ